MKQKKPKIVFISWAPYCSRSDNIARELGGESYLVYIHFLGSNYLTIWLKYLIQTIKTFVILIRDRPEVIFVMSPPVIACIPVLFYCILLGKRYIIDAHTAAFLHKRWKGRKRLNSFFTKRAVLTTVTNDHLGRIVERWGGQYRILSDVPITFSNCECDFLTKSGSKRIVTLVNTFAPDEPLENFVAAASRLENIDIYITGKITRDSKHYLRYANGNITFTDFLSDGEYGCLLMNSDIVCVFTTRDHTMLRGAYEANYLNKPIVTSNWDLLRMKFPLGAVHVDNSIDGIEEGIYKALNNIEALTAEAKMLSKLKRRQWDEVKRGLIDFIKAGQSAGKYSDFIDQI